MEGLNRTVIEGRPTLIFRENMRVRLAIQRPKACEFGAMRGDTSPQKTLAVSVQMREFGHGELCSPLCPPEGAGAAKWTAKFIGGYGSDTPSEGPPCPVWNCTDYFLPQSTLNEFTDAAGWPRVRSLSIVSGVTDSVLHHLAQSVLPLLLAPDQACQEYLKHYVSMVCAYVVKTYAQFEPVNVTSKGGLAPWQKRKVSDVMQKSPGQNRDLSALAKVCGLSPSHFARCFKKTFGITVHRYIIRQRIDWAKEMLIYSPMSLTEVAIRTGFADQAAFGRTFGAFVGETPAKWRKEQLHAVRAAKAS